QCLRCTIRMSAYRALQQRIVVDNAALRTARRAARIALSRAPEPHLLSGTPACTMALVRSISDIRGTIGGALGEGLTPLDTVRYAAAFGTLVRRRSGKDRPRMVLGRAARIS